MFVSEMNGIGLKMPYTMGAFAVCAFGITGLPFMAGFISKWNIALGSLQAGQGVFIAILIGSALLSTCYLVPIVYKAFFKEPDNIIHHQNIDRMADFGERDTSNAMLLPLIVAAICAVLLGVFPNLGAGFYDLAIMTADNIFGAELTLGGK
jgi:multicomponent Na+:H+ antiporter subunit D